MKSRLMTNWQRLIWSESHLSDSVCVWCGLSRGGPWWLWLTALGVDCVKLLPSSWWRHSNVLLLWQSAPKTLQTETRQERWDCVYMNVTHLTLCICSGVENRGFRSPYLQGVLPKISFPTKREFVRGTFHARVQLWMEYFQIKWTKRRTVQQVV